MSTQAHVLLIENTIAGLCYGSCLTLSLSIFRSLLFSPYVTTSPGLSRKKRFILLGCTFLALLLSSFYFIPPVYGRAKHLDGHRIGHDGKLIEPEAWIYGKWERGLALGNDALACLVLEYLVYLTWHDHGFVMGVSFVTLFLHLIGSPLIFETVTAILTLVALFISFRNSSFSHIKPKRTPITFTFVSILFAILAWINEILHFVGVIDDGLLRLDPKIFHSVDFMRPLLYLGAFLVQALVYLYWTDGGKMFADESCGADSEGGRILLGGEEREN